MSKKHPHFDLSFVSKGTPTPFWSVTPSGNWTDDWCTGAELGAEYLTFIGRHPISGSVVLFGWIVADMATARQGKLTSLELGFLRAVNEYAMFVARMLASPDSSKQEKTSPRAPRSTRARAET